jgi:hypothetical protein
MDSEEIECGLSVLRDGGVSAGIFTEVVMVYRRYNSSTGWINGKRHMTKGEIEAELLRRWGKAD